MVSLLIHFPNGQSLKYPDIRDKELINSPNYVGYEDHNAKVMFNKNIIAGCVIKQEPDDETAD